MSKLSHLKEAQLLSLHSWNDAFMLLHDQEESSVMGHIKISELISFVMSVKGFIQVNWDLCFFIRCIFTLWVVS